MPRTSNDPIHRAITNIVREEVAAEVKRALRGFKVPTSGMADAPTGTRAMRTTAQVEAVGAKVLAYVKKHPGSRLEEIGRGMGVETAGLKRPIQGLLAAGALRTEGQKRGTMYFAGKGKAGPAKAKATRKKAGKRTAAKRGKKANGRGK